MKIDTILQAKGIIKKYVDVSNDEYKNIWKRSKLPIQDSEFKAKNKKAGVAVKEKNEDIYEITEADVKKYVDELSKYNGDRDELQKKILLCQLTVGARLIEILNPEVSSFKLDKNNIIQTGTAKSKIGEYDKKQSIVKLNVFIKPKPFIKLINEIRTETASRITGKTNKQITDSFSSNLNKTIKKILKKLNIPYNRQIASTHGSRRLYVAWAYYKSDKKISLPHLIKTLLGHSNYSSVANYDTIRVV